MNKFSIDSDWAALLAAGQAPRRCDGPQFTAGRQTPPPSQTIASGSGSVPAWAWSYGPLAQNRQDQDPPFDNVFVNPTAYRAFLADR